MNARDRLLQAGTAAALECAARRGLAALEAAIGRMTPRQLQLLDRDFLTELRAEAAQRQEI